MWSIINTKGKYDPINLLESLNQKFGKKIFRKFGDIEIWKQKSHQHKRPISIKKYRY